MVEKLTLLAAAWQFVVDSVSGSTKWIWHGTVPAHSGRTLIATDSVLLLLVVAGPQLLGQVFRDFSLLRETVGLRIGLFGSSWVPRRVQTNLRLQPLFRDNLRCNCLY